MEYMYTCHLSKFSGIFTLHYVLSFPMTSDEVSSAPEYFSNNCNFSVVRKLDASGQL